MSRGGDHGPPALAGDGAVDHAELALLELVTSDEAQRCCGAALGVRDAPGAVLVEDVMYSPGRDCVVLLRIDRPGNGATASRRAVVTVRRDDVLRGVYRERYAPVVTSAAGMPRAAFLEDRGYLVEVFPMDWKLPWLPWALDPAEVSALMPAIDRSGSGVTVLRYLPHRRAVLAYPAARGGEVVGKLFARRVKAEQAWRTLKAIHSVKRGRDLVVPAPLGRVEDRDFLLMEHIPGTPLTRVLSQAEPATTGRHAVAAAARTLTELHDLALPDLPPPRPKLDEVRRLARRLRRVAPSLVERVGVLLDTVPPTLASGSSADALVHGAYAPRQLLLDADRVAIVDVDSAGRGDPAADVGYFMASLHEDAIATGRDELRALASHFLDCYLAARPCDGLAHRARVHQSIVLMRAALHSFCKPRQSPGDPSLLPHLLLEEAAECARRA